MHEKRDLSGIVEKIKKLMALAESSNENEAALAAERAQALLAKHNLSMSDVTTSSSRPVKFDNELVTNAYEWRRIIGAGIAEMCFCRYFYSSFKRSKTSYDKHIFIGEEHNIIVAKLMFMYLVETVDNMAKAGAKRFPKERQSTYRSTFRNACAKRLNIRMMRRIQETSQGPTGQIGQTQLPALRGLYAETKEKLDAFVDQALGKDIVPTRKRNLFEKDIDGLREGNAAGEKISLDRQIDKEEQQLLS